VLKASHKDLGNSLDGYVQEKTLLKYFLDTYLTLSQILSFHKVVQFPVKRTRWFVKDMLLSSFLHFIFEKNSNYGMYPSVLLHYSVHYVLLLKMDRKLHS